MKKISKLLALVLALALCLCMAPAAFAANGGSITIKNSMADTTYNAYKIFDATVSGADGKISYLATEVQKNWFEDQPENPFTFTALNGGTKYTVVATEGKDVIAFLKAHFSVANGAVTTNIEGVDGTNPTGTVSGNNGSATISNLPYGYYFVTSNTGAVVTITSTNPSATVADKNTTPGWTPDDPTDPEKDGGKSIVTADNKTVDKNTVNIGDTVKFQIAINATNYNSDKLITDYIIDDTLDAGFTLTNPSDIKVSVGATDLTLDTDYTIANPTDKAFSINIFWATKGDDGKYTFNHTSDASSAVITVTYSATLNNSAKVGTANVNTANFTWKEVKVDPKDPTKPTDPTPTVPTDNPDPDKTETYTYSFDLVKTDGEKNLLNGAEFKLYTEDQVENKDASNPGAGKKLKEGATPMKFTPSDTTYTFAKTGDNATITVTNGQVKISGLKGGVPGTNPATSTTYYLEETKAPDGYNILTELKPVTIEAANKDATVNGNVYVSNGVQVENKAGQLLPSTGGIGTTIFYVVGGLLTLVAGVLLITKKRMNNID